MFIPILKELLVPAKVKLNFKSFQRKSLHQRRIEEKQRIPIEMFIHIHAYRDYSKHFELLLFLGHDKMIFCLAATHTSVFKTPCQAFFLD